MPEAWTQMEVDTTQRKHLGLVGYPLATVLTVGNGPDGTVPTQVVGPHKIVVESLLDWFESF